MVKKIYKYISEYKMLDDIHNLVVGLSGGADSVCLISVLSVIARDYIEEIGHGESVGIFIGPEGGFDRAELDEAVDAGAEVITLGNRILRTETAGMMLLSVLMFNMEGK